MNYVLYGEEQYELESALSRILKQHHIEKDDLNMITYDALQSDMQTIMEDATTIPFFAEQKVILVRNANFLSTVNDTDMDIALLDKYLDAPMESTILIFTGSFEKMDARKKIVKKIQKTCKVLQFHRLDALGKQNYIREEIKRRNLSVEPNAFLELDQRLPLDIRSIKAEMEKLELFGGAIDVSVVEQLVNRPLEDDVFQLVNAVVDCDLKKAFTLWYDLCVLNKDAIYLIALLAGQFRFLYQVKVLMDQGAGKDMIVSKLSAHPYRVQLTMQNARKLSTPYLLQILSKLAVLDQKMKGGQLDKKLGFEMFLLELQGDHRSI